ncbi:MAG: cya 3, partial [Planctomycetaceae bacterium]|nr:cya 3 [Planctomycetaceae bacterium]
LQVNWGDGSPTQMVNVVGGAFTLSHTYLDDNPTGTPSDVNTISLTLTDSHGATATTSTQITIVNQSPVLTGLSLTPVINAGGSAMLVGSYTDAGTQDTQLVDINWGDGTPLQTVNVSGGTFNIPHVYVSASSANGNLVQIRLRDDDIPQNGPGGANGSALILVLNVAPTFSGTPTLSASSINENGSVTLSGSYADPGDLGNHNLAINWGDGTPTQTISVSGGTFSVAHQYLDDNPTGTPSDINIITATILDAGGLSSAKTISVTVNNVNPVATIVGAPATGSLNVPISLTSTVTDVGTKDTFTYAWTVTRNGAVYATGNSAGFSFTPTSAGTFAVSLVVTDDDLGTSGANAASTTIQVNGPTTGVITVAPVTVSGKPTDVVLSAVDPNNANGNPNFTFSIDWNGDGVVDQTVIGPSGTKVTHEFNDPGLYQVRVTATPIGSATPGITATAPVSVVRTLLLDGVLYLGGTSQNDIITISRVSSSAVKVLFNGHSVGKFSPTVRIEVYGCPGNDKIRVDRSILLPVQLYGEDGIDLIKGGGGNDYINGGNGNDKINGSRGYDISDGGAGDDTMHAGSGRDIVIGGLGQDTIYGKFERDILVGGTTSHDGNLTELQAIQQEWITDADFQTRISHLENGGGLNGNVKLRPGIDTIDDGARDNLTAGYLKQNWFLTFPLDHVYHQSKSDQVN